MSDKSLFEPLTRVVNEFVKTIPVSAQPLGDEVQGHFLKSMSDERGPLPLREFGVDEPRQ